MAGAGGGDLGLGEFALMVGDCGDSCCDVGWCLLGGDAWGLDVGLSCVLVP